MIEVARIRADAILRGAWLAVPAAPPATLTAAVGGGPAVEELTQRASRIAITVERAIP